MSNWRKRRTTITFEHPEYNEYWMSINRTRALIGQPPIPHGEPLDIAVTTLVTPRQEPIGIGYCHSCNEIMLVNNEQQKWCPACRAARRRKYLDKRNPRSE